MQKLDYKNNFINRTKDSFYELNELENEKNDSILEVLLFFSFDIVNSTAYKEIKKDNWHISLNKIFNEIVNIVGLSLESIKVENYKIWRVIGDEIIFTIVIEDLKTLFKIIHKLNKSIANINKKLEEYNDYISKLAIKSAAWISAISKVHSTGKDEENENVCVNNSYFKYTSILNKNEYIGQEDYLGNDIDSGFRIKRHSESGKLILSFEIAKLILEDRNYSRYLKIIKYEKEKGIWGNAPYPIICYYADENTKFEDSFLYYERETSKLLNSYLENHKNKEGKKFNHKMFTNIDYALCRIEKDLMLTPKMDLLKNSIKPKVHTIKSKEINLLHLVSVCFIKDEFLILKRKPSNKEERWEFGCVKSIKEMELENEILKAYKKNYNLDIEIIKYEDRDKLSSLKPFFTYQIKNETNLYEKGIIFLAKTYNKIENKDQIKDDNITDFFYGTLNEIKTKIKNDATVDDFYNTLEYFDKYIKDNKLYE